MSDGDVLQAVGLCDTTPLTLSEAKIPFRCVKAIGYHLIRPPLASGVYKGLRIHRREVWPKWTHDDDREFDHPKELAGQCAMTPMIWRANGDLHC